eukprot:scaffold5168_cov176-Amphora_coffeaeformis.AAC.2
MLRKDSFLRLRSLWRSKASRRFFTRSNDNTRWGILSAGKISSDFCQALHFTPGSQPYAVAARDATRASAFADRYAVDKFYGSYEALLADPDVDVVYIGSIADQHAKLARMALEARKPTVVEKPLTLNYQESKELVDYAKTQQTFLMEGMWTRCFPSSHVIRTWISQGKIGEPFMIQGDFGWSTANCDASNRIWYADSGGLILDVAMYMGQWGFFVYGSDAVVDSVQAMGTVKHGVDYTSAANSRFRFGGKKDNGDDAYGFMQFYVSGQANTEERLVIQGTKGRIVIEPPSHTPTRIRLELDVARGTTTVEAQELPEPDDSYTAWNNPGSIGFRHQITAVNQALAEGRVECPDYTWEESLKVAALLDEIKHQVHRKGPQ